MAMIIRSDRAEALRLAAERPAAVQIGVVVDLHEGLELHPERLAVAQHAAMVVGQAPRTGIDVEAGIELAFLGKAAELGVAIAAAQGPVAAAGARVVLEHLHLIAGLAQFVGRHEPRDAGAQDQHLRSARSAAQLDGPLVSRNRRRGRGSTSPDTSPRRPRSFRSSTAAHAASATCSSFAHLLGHLIVVAPRGRGSVYFLHDIAQMAPHVSTMGRSADRRSRRREIFLNCTPVLGSSALQCTGVKT